MGGMTVGVDLRESEVVVVVERWEGVFKLEFGCDISVLGGLGPIKEGVATRASQQGCQQGRPST